MNTQTITPRLHHTHRWPLAALAFSLTLAVGLAMAMRPAPPAASLVAHGHPVTAAMLAEFKQAQAEAQDAIVVGRSLPDATTAAELGLLKQAQFEVGELMAMPLPDATTAAELAVLKQARHPAP